MARNRWEGLPRATVPPHHWPQDPMFHATLLSCQALTAEIVKTIRDIIALNPLYRLVSCTLPNRNLVAFLRPGWALSVAPGSAEVFLKSVLVENLLGARI